MVEALERGLVGLLVTDRDAHLLHSVFQHLDRALERVLETGRRCVDLAVSLRCRDQQAIAACKSYASACINQLHFLETDYDAEFSNNYHCNEVLEAICSQRNTIREFALDHSYRWLFFLDSDILLEPHTLELLLSSGKACVGAVYVPRWSCHTVVGVNQGEESRGESVLQLLLNPHLLCSDVLAVPCAILGFGATLIRRSLLHIPYRIQESLGGVKGEDIGFCIDLLALGNAELLPHFLTCHKVEHISASKAPRPFIPRLDDNFPLLTRVASSQLFFVENDFPLNWIVARDYAAYLRFVTEYDSLSLPSPREFSDFDGSSHEAVASCATAANDRDCARAKVACESKSCSNPCENNSCSATSTPTPDPLFGSTAASKHMEDAVIVSIGVSTRFDSQSSYRQARCPPAATLNPASPINHDPYPADLSLDNKLALGNKLATSLFFPPQSVNVDCSSSQAGLHAKSVYVQRLTAPLPSPKKQHTPITRFSNE